MTRLKLIASLVLVILPAVFLADGRNREQFSRMVRNAAAGAPVNKGIRFSVPFLATPTPPPRTYPAYPESVVWGEDVNLRLEDLGAGYWQSSAINLWSGAILEGDKATLGHLRFKLNPPDDPIHPGHAALALPGDWHVVRFSPMNPAEWATRTDFSRQAWRNVADAEVPALWALRAGQAFVMRVELKRPEAPPPPTPTATVTASASTMSAPPRPARKPPKRLLAKIFLRKLSLDNVRFDYVLQTDGSFRIPLRDPRSLPAN
ncbi:MAG: hypothetical protein VKO64_00380 [Candidatus Sericytochromatia bacterium]|nr:hypothetical protein [Candidatus Sericytochromatia bacterium]